MHFLSKGHAKSKKTMCPANSKKADAGCGYKTGRPSRKLRELGGLLERLKVVLWDEGEGIANTLSQRKAVFHHHCRSLLHPTSFCRHYSLLLKVVQPQSENITQKEIFDDFKRIFIENVLPHWAICDVLCALLCILYGD